MANSSIALPASGVNADTFVVESGDHRQVVVVGSPTTDANVQEVNETGAALVALADDPQPTIGTYDAEILLELRRIAFILADISGTYPNDSELE
jgi:hypothetical protein